MKDYRYLFIDYFDTTVFRKVYPQKTKELWAKEVEREMSYRISSDLLLRFRLDSEIQLSINKGTYDYRELMLSVLFKIRCQIKLDNTDEYYINCFKEIEEEIELNNQFVNQENIDFIKNQREKGIQIYLISDFYLGIDSYYKFLNHLGISNLFDKIYVSCDYGTSKSDGSLYLMVLQTNAINPDDVLMIGDFKRSDYSIPRQLGLNSILYCPKRQQKLYKKQIKKTSEKKINRTFRERSVFGNYAFSLYLFCDSLYKQCFIDNTKRLFFLSREGLFLKKLFDLYQKDKPNKIETEYLFVSRNSTFVASLKSINLEDFDAIFREYRNISQYDFLKALSFSEEEIGMLGIIDVKRIISRFSLSEEYEALKKNKLFVEIYEKKRDAQKKAFLTYLKLNNYNGGLISVVDVGWKGSMQDNMSKILPGEGIRGYYLGINNFGIISEKNEKRGLLIDKVYYKPFTKTHYFEYEHYLFEEILVANHGRTTSYSDEGKPLLCDDGDVQAYKSYVQGIQTNIETKFIELMKEFGESVLSERDMLLFEDAHAKMFKHLSIKELFTWYCLVMLHIDSFISIGQKRPSMARFIIKHKIHPWLKLKNYR